MSGLSNSVSEDHGTAQDFAHHDDYSTLMLGARRKAAPHIGTPAITRHLGFWIPDKLTLERNEWIKHIEASFVTLYLHLVEFSKKDLGAPAPKVKKKKGDAQPRLYECIKRAEDQPTRHQRFLLSFVWQSMPVDLTLELFDEYFTLSTTIDLSRCPLPSDTELGKAIEDFNRLAFTRYGAIHQSDEAAAKAPQEKEFAHAFNVIYNTVWDDLHREIFAAPFKSHSETLGQVFAEFRGFVACRRDPKFITIDGNVEQRLEYQIGSGRFNETNAIRCVDAIRPFMAADAWLHREPNDKRGAKCPKLREFTFTRILNSRYIYASALGTPPSHLRDRDMPLTYMLLAANHCPSELGLLVDGFHVLGTTRLAALYDFPHLTHAALELRDLEDDISAFLGGMMEVKPGEDVAAAGKRLAQILPTFTGRLGKIEQGIRSDDDKRTHAAQDLRELERDISKLHRSMMEEKIDDDVAAAVERLAQKLRYFFGRLAKIEQRIRSKDHDKQTYAARELHELERDIGKLHRSMMEGKTDDDPAAAVERLAQKLRYFSRRLAKIEQGISGDDDDKPPQIVGGLPFRVERSHYYQRQFRGLVSGLRIGRIQGFLTYDEAVARRLGGIYDLINTVGLRHERLREILTVLSRRVQTGRQLKQTGAINKETRIIEKLQKGAEVAFWAFLFPYYFGSVLIHITNAIYLTDLTKPHGKVSLLEKATWLELTILLFAILAGAFRAFQAFHRKREDDTPAEERSETASL
jgi:hypothetical protein